MLFLRRGMLGWARSVSGAGVQRERAATAYPDPREPCGQSAIVHVFASMAMKLNERRRTP
jgi:hypothetical protein